MVREGVRADLYIHTMRLPTLQYLFHGYRDLRLRLEVESPVFFPVGTAESRRGDRYITHDSCTLQFVASCNHGGGFLSSSLFLFPPSSLLLPPYPLCRPRIA